MNSPFIDPAFLIVMMVFFVPIAIAVVGFTLAERSQCHARSTLVSRCCGRKDPRCDGGNCLYHCNDLCGASCRLHASNEAQPASWTAMKCGPSSTSKTVN